MLIRTDMPPVLQYPVGRTALPFVCGLIRMFYGPSLLDVLHGLGAVLSALLFPQKSASSHIGGKE